jgi:hypothetical protein
LGLSENYLYDKIINGMENPSSGELSYNSEVNRLNNLTGYVTYIIGKYNTVRKNQLKIVKKWFTNFEFKNTHKMPIILDNFYDQLDSIIDINNKNNYTLNAICNALITIKKASNKDWHSNDIFEYLYKNIIYFEKMKSVIKESDDIGVKTKYLVEFEFENNVIDDNVVEQDDIDEEITDPFSLDALDIDTTNTGADDEDFLDD